MSEERGVGSVIGAVIVLTILFTSVSSYLLFVERGDQRVNDSQKIRLERLRERSMEDLEISLINDDGLKVNVTNLGPLTTTIVYYILISIEDNNVIKNDTISITLKDGDNNIIDLEFTPDNYDYMIKLVTERGSIFTDICYNGCYETTELNYSNNGSSDSITLGPMDVSLNLEYAVFTSSDDIEFNEPTGIAVDNKDRIIVADTYNHRIQVFDSNGKFLFKFGSKGDEDGEFDDPEGIAADSNDRIIVADTYNHRIQVFDSNGKFLFKFGSKGDE
ncbi:MAG: 6-bladed beta-propeller, partial [Candidatus Nitrosothermus koennekii]